MGDYSMRKNVVKKVMAFLLLWVFCATSLSLPKSVRAVEEASFLPEDSVGLFYHDFSSDVKEAQTALYTAYDTGLLIKGSSEAMRFMTKDDNARNGIKLDITNHVNMGNSGDIFGASARIKVEGWNKADNKANQANLFIEVVSEAGEKTSFPLDSKGPDATNSNLTDAQYSMGDNWLTEALSGQMKVNFNKNDRIYLCINQSNTNHFYDDICLFAYMDPYADPTNIEVSTPELNIIEGNASFTIKNLTVEDMDIVITIKAYEGDILKKIDEYKTLLESGDQQDFDLPARKGDIIVISDSKGDEYISSLKLGEQKWVGTWASAQQGLSPDRNEYPPEPGLANNTLRQIVRISKGGTQLRFEFSNEYGKEPLEIIGAHIAKLVNVGDSLIDTSTERALIFQGSESITILPGQMAVSDPIEFPVKDLERIAITTSFGQVPINITSHTGARTTTFLMRGNHVSDVSMPISTQFIHWYFISGIDVMANDNTKAIAILGDSITDGYGVTTNADNRWTDTFAERLLANPSTAHRTVLNQGIGGNSIFGGLGPAARNRFKRDILDQDGVGYVIIFTGVNDIGYGNSPNLAKQMIDEYIKFAELAHEAGIKVYGGTITPFGGNSGYYSQLREQIRQEVNDWIRTNEYFDGVIDFDAALRDTVNPVLLAREYNNDGLHPSLEGYKKIGELVDLALFTD